MNDMDTAKRRVVSGMRPTGKLHLGHLVGALGTARSFQAGDAVYWGTKVVAAALLRFARVQAHADVQAATTGPLAGLQVPLGIDGGAHDLHRRIHAGKPALERAGAVSPAGTGVGRATSSQICRMTCCWSSVSALMTGTVACSASSATDAWLNVRMTIAST